MTKREFGLNIQLLNAGLPENKGLVEDTTLDTYFLLLKKYSNEAMQKGIILLLENETFEYGVSITPALLIKYIQKGAEVKEKYDKIWYQISKIDTLLYASMPNYKANIKEAIAEVGGWNAIKKGNELDLNNMKNKFIEKLTTVNPILLSLSENKKIKS